MTTPIVVINLWPLTGECCVCERDISLEYALPTYEDLILPNDWKGEWFGNACCKRCFDRFNVITQPLSISDARKAVTQESECYSGA